MTTVLIISHRKLTSATPTLKAPSTGPKPTVKGSPEAAATAAAATQKYVQELQKIPELASYNGVLKSSSVIELTESETEYVVKAVKHVFKEHVVLQFVSPSHCTLLFLKTNNMT